MLAALTALLAAVQPAQLSSARIPGRPAWLVATVGQSEWCPAGIVRLDLRTGRYALTPRAPRRNCSDAGLERAVTTGKLDSKRLAAVLEAASRAAGEGLETQACRNGRRGEAIAISNGGPQILVLATGAAAQSASDDLACWSASAYALHGLLDDIFPSDTR